MRYPQTFSRVLTHTKFSMSALLLSTAVVVFVFPTTAKADDSLATLAHAARDKFQPVSTDQLAAAK